MVLDVSQLVEEEVTLFWDKAVMVDGDVDGDVEEVEEVRRLGG